MGNKNSTSQNNGVMGQSHADDQTDQASNWGATAPPPNHPKDGDISKCPVMGYSSGKRKGNTGTNPMTAMLAKQDTAAPSSSSAAASPSNNKTSSPPPSPKTVVNEEARKKHDDGYEEAYSEINPLNNMPMSPSQMPHPDQKKLLPTTRQLSTIPRTKSDNAWLYPSEQMFYNALKKKNKFDSEITEDDLKAIVSVHNGMNEKTWRELLRWESCIQKDCPNPTLMHFMGRPDDLTPKAYLKHYLLRYPLPFDRHDWVIDRCGKKQRYIIDFYYSENVHQESEVVNGFLESKRITIDVRPALDSWQNAYDRLKFFFSERFDKMFGKPKTA